MDNDVLVLVSKFAVAARKVIGPINAAKIIKDKDYATAVFEKVDNVGDEGLLMISLELIDRLGWLNTYEEVMPAIAKKENVPAAKYLYGARS